MNFLGTNTIFGLDIGHESLKVAVVSMGGGGRIISQAEVPIPRAAKSRQGIKDKDVIAQKIKEAKAMAKPHHITTKVCVSALPESLVFTKIIELPKMTDKEITKAMPFQLTNAFPVSQEEAYFDWALLGPGPNPNTLEALVVAAPKPLVDDYVDVVEKSGSELIALETKPAALTRLFGRLAPKGGMIIIDIGAVLTGIDLVVDGNLQLTATVDIGAEHLKKDPTSLEAIAKEINSLVKYYINRLQKKTDFTAVVVCGGGANLANVAPTLQKLLNMPVEVKKPALQSAYNPTFATVLGLAMRGNK